MAILALLSHQLFTESRLPWDLLLGFCIAIIVREQFRVLLVEIYLRIALRRNQTRERIRTFESLDLLVLNLGIHVLDV